MAEEKKPRESRHDDEPSGPQNDRGDIDICLIATDELPVQKVTALDGGAKRDGYFKRRDYLSF